MSLKARLLTSIVALVAVIVVALSALYLGVVIETSFDFARDIAVINLRQVESFIRNRAPAEVARRTPPPASVDELVDAYVEAIGRDIDLGPLLRSLIANSPVIVEGRVTGPSEQIVAASIETRRGSRHALLPLFEEFERKSLPAKIIEALYGNQDYEVVRDLGVEVEGAQRRVVTIRMILSTVLLRQEEVFGRARGPAIVSLAALLLSVAAALVVSHLAVRPFARIGELIDRIARGESAEAADARRAREVAAVESKLNVLGEQFRGARDDARRLRSNIDQLLARLEGGVFLFDRDDRLLMAAGAAERLIGARWDLMGRSLDEIFPARTDLGAMIQGAARLRKNIKNYTAEFAAPNGKATRLTVGVEIVEQFPGRDRAGTVVTLREAEPRRQLERHLDVATRLAAISRLTSGAAHEIKNPLNSIALHLEVLKSQVEPSGVGEREIEVIAREIRQLDRVVKSFLDFTRPVELNVKPVNLGDLVDELAALVGPDAERNGVRVVAEHGSEPAWTSGDRDLVKQALLNVVMNGIQAMPKGGELRIALERSDEDWLTRIVDQGAGIPPEISEKIFQLYFTTKEEKGSGIGLAMAFQVVQMHGGTLDFSSVVGEGSEFRVRLPAAPEEPPALEESA